MPTPLTESEAQIVNQFIGQVSSLTNRFRGSDDFNTALSNHAYNRWHSLQDANQRTAHNENARNKFLGLLIQIQDAYNTQLQSYPTLPVCIKKYNEFDQHNIPKGIIVFQEFFFAFPLEWNILCPQELLGIPIRFQNCHFFEGFFLRNNADIGNLTFSDIGNWRTLHLDNVGLHNLFFNNTQSFNHVVFKDVVASGYIHFQNTVIQGEFCCDNVSAKNGLSYNVNIAGKFCIFNSKLHRLDIANAQFGQFDSRPPSSSDITIGLYRTHHILSKSIVFFHNNTFANDAIFEGANFNVPLEMRNVNFKGDARFNDCKFNRTTLFQNVVFHKSPKFHEVHFHEETDFSTARFLDFNSPSSYRDYSTLKHSMNELNAEIETHRFHAYELKSRYNTVLPKWKEFLEWRKLNDAASKLVEKFSSWFFKLVSDYHQDLLRPFLCLFFVGLYFACLYAVMGAVHCLPDATDKKNYWLIGICGNDVKEAIIFSIQQTIWPVGVILQNEVWNIQTYGMKVAAFFHLLITTIIWFLLIFGIRKRFKL